MRILYVEDNRELRSTVAIVLRRAGHDVTLDASGDDAIARLEAGERFDLVVLDHHMPGVHGAPLVSAVRRQLPGVPVIALTGLDDQARAAGYSLVLQKPVSVEALVAGIRSALNGGLRG